MTLKKEIKLNSNNDIFENLKSLTKARIGLPTKGASLSTKHQLLMMESHAKAKDAIFYKINFNRLSSDISAKLNMKCTLLKSKVTNRQDYLKSIESGRNLCDESIKTLKEKFFEKNKINFVIADGLSPLGIDRYSANLVSSISKRLKNFDIGDLFVVEQGRVAIADDIGETLKSLMTVVLIGERPGLTSFDSVGAYITYMPRLGKNDSERNCVSNICDSGLKIEEAADKIAHLILSALEMKLTGTELKDDSVLLTKKD